MNSIIRLSVLFSCLGGAAAAGAALPDTAPKAGERCEAAVAETIRRMRGRDAQEVEFVGAKRALTPALDDEDETAVKGEGRYRAAAGGTVSFSYSCAFNARTGATSGVVFRDTGRVGAAADTVAWQPDLSQFTPDACEAATAAALKSKYPRIGTINFDAGTRQLRPTASDNTSLEGRGALVRAPGMNAAPFSYRCEFEPRGGKVVSVQTRE